MAAVAALAGVLVFDTLPGLFIGIGVSLLLLLYRASRPNVAVLGRLPSAQLRQRLGGRHGVQLVLARDIGQVRDVLRRAGAEDEAAALFPSVEDAVRRVR